VPYGSWYLTGFLMEKPLGDLRRDLAELGYERQENVHEPEDHVAALCEVMALLISDDGLPFGSQRRFFETHVSSWIETFFNDLEQAKAADFYRAVGRLGGAFIRLEKQYLSMPV
jgi:TorA maturation chaperone TorD